MSRTRTPVDQWHRLSDIDDKELTATCSMCGPVRVRRRVLRNGSLAYYCRVKHRTYSRGPAGRQLLGRDVVIQKALHCERCGFIPQIPQQLEIHHRDRNPDNNRPQNIETVCANCHRLEHFGGQR